MEVEKIIIHEKYTSDADEYDIAIIKLTDPVVPSDHVIPACFPSPLAELAEGSKCYITGTVEFRDTDTLWDDEKCPCDRGVRLLNAIFNKDLPLRYWNCPT